MFGSLVAQGHDGVHAHGPPCGNPGRKEAHPEKNQEREAEKKRVMSVHLEQQRLEEARAEPRSQETQGRAANRPTGDIGENHLQYALRSGAQRHSHANLARLLLHKEANDPIDADRREQDAYTNKDKRTALKRGRSVSLPTRVFMPSITTGTVESTAAASERIHCVIASGLMAL